MSLDAATLSALHQYLAGQQEAMRDMLAELVKLPSDNPPGDCAASREMLSSHSWPSQA